MSKARLVITAVTVENRSIGEVAASYGVARSWVYELLARYREEGEAAFEPRSRRPRTSPNATPATTVELVLRLRKELTDAGRDAGADTVRWHLEHDHRVVLSRATVHRILVRYSQVVPTRRNVPSPPTSGSRLNSPTRPGNPTSPTTGSATPTAPRAPTSRSSPGSTTTPATPCTSAPTPGSPRRSWSTPSPKPPPSTAIRHPR
jgi:transposase